jgi:ElaB/YqjD/DUF883 family membrane-anchored ribosome-binding protein
MADVTTATRGSPSESGTGTRIEIHETGEPGREGRGGEQMREAAQRAAEEARSRAASLLDDQREGIASTLGAVAEAVRRSGQDVRDAHPMVARFAEQAAGGLERACHALRERDAGDLVERARDFARRQPTVFLGGAVAVGFVLARLTKGAVRTAAAGAARGAEPRGEAGPEPLVSSGVPGGETGYGSMPFPAPMGGGERQGR